MTGRRLGFVALAGIGVVVAFVGVRTEHEAAGPTAMVEIADRRDVDHEFLVPPGTGERLARGEELTLIPNPLVVRIGDTVRIRNLDRDPIVLGPFYVGAHTVLTQRFVEPGRLVGDCLAHPSGRLVVKVHA